MLTNFFIGLIVALLPERVRRRRIASWHGNLRSAAATSGIMQMLGCVGMLLVRYPRFFESRFAGLNPNVMISAAETGGDTAVRGFGIIVLFAYIITPASMVLIYFAFEGVVRLFGAVTTGEVVGTLPLTIADWSATRLRELHVEKKQGPRIPDMVAAPPVEGCGYDLSIASCRAKPGWDHLLTISYNDTLYEVAEYVEGDIPRKHVYLLRRAPAHKVIRGLHHYDPEEVLQGK